MSRAPDRLFLDFQSALAGRYSLERELGRGGMGVVYSSLALAVACGAAAFLVPYPAILVVFGLSSAVAVATGIVAHAAAKQRLDVEEEHRLKLWRGPIGRWLFKLARIDGLTADLGAARRIGEQVDALLEGRREVDDAVP